MMHKLFKLCTLVVLVLSGLSESHAQGTVVSTGSDLSGTGGSVSYTLGQTTYSNNSGTGGSELQGVQQPYEIFTITGIKENDLIRLNYSISPNPVTDALTLKVEKSPFKDMSFQLFDLEGHLVAKENLSGDITTIYMNNYLPSTYFLRVLETRENGSIKQLKTFKIIKN